MRKLVNKHLQKIFGQKTLGSQRRFLSNYAPKKSKSMTLSSPSLQVRSPLRNFRRRETIPAQDGVLWQIEAGAVRTFTVSEEGAVISLGFWGIGDIIGQPLSRVQPYQIECLTDVSTSILKPGEFWELNRTMLAHIHQMQELLRIRSGLIHQRLRLFLNWLAYKFGQVGDEGMLIPLRLTHQDIADVLGTTRVTVTRLLQQLEQEGTISWSDGHHILLNR
jgi:CRP-like cAMP-binding protein